MAFLKETPWDERAFGMPTYELLELSQEALIESDSKPGHFTIKVDPLAPKMDLHTHGFYYCDTLIIPACRESEFQSFDHEDVTISQKVDISAARAVCREAFTFDRFHRDFHIDASQADRRYNYWLSDLLEKKQVYALLYENKQAGFFAFEESRILLHALSNQFRGQGLAKYFWSQAIRALFSKGYSSVESSISAANLPVLNLYRKLGFSFIKAVDVYHKFNM